MIIPEFDTFGELALYLSNLPNQTKGQPAAVCETGEPYVEFYESALARPDDIGVIERIVDLRMTRSLNDYMRYRRGRIYWRSPFEHEVCVAPVVIRYDDSGPDTDILTDRKCHLDKNWRSVSCYCRFYQAMHRTSDSTAAA